MQRANGWMDGWNKCASSETLSRRINAHSPPSLLAAYGFRCTGSISAKDAERLSEFQRRRHKTTITKQTTHSVSGKKKKHTIKKF